MSSLQPVIMMCQPRHFDVSYSINPWMAPDEWAENSAALGLQSSDGWQKLTEKLQVLGARLVFQEPQPGLPDLVFTANAAVVMDRKAMVARYRHPERQGEEPHDLRFFRDLQAKGLLDVVEMTPEGIILEGAGDCVWDEVRRQFWVGYGQRSDRTATEAVRRFFGLEATGLELVDPRYYHMDTALVPLTGGEIMYYPGAFSAKGQAIIREQAGAENLIAVPQEDAECLGVNAVNLGRDIVLAKASDRFKAMLEERGYTLHQLPISSFSKSGGSAFCLTLRLDRVSG
jgi:N-dimethylarginine dimethylaminohydrolase